MNDTREFFALYWHLYGGWRALFRSPYLYLALALNIISYPLWQTAGDGTTPWTGLAVDIVPNLLAFSLGGMAIFLAFSNESFLKIIQSEGKTTSLYMKASATFFHFIFIQTITLLVSLVNISHESTLVSFTGCFLLMYSLSVAVATARLLLQMARVFNATSGLPQSEKSKG